MSQRPACPYLPLPRATTLRDALVYTRASMSRLPDVVHGSPLLRRLMEAARPVLTAATSLLPLQDVLAAAAGAVPALSALLWAVLFLHRLLLCRGWHGHLVYTTDGRTAFLTIRSTSQGWELSDHVATRSAKGDGRGLREALAPALRNAADAAGAPILVTAANRTLADLYRQEEPELREVNTTLLGRVRLVRPPRRAILPG